MTLYTGWMSKKYDSHSFTGERLSALLPEQPVDSSRKVVVYTDGSFDETLKVGGWGAYLVRKGGRREELSGKLFDTTKLRTEMTALLEALRTLGEPHQVLVKTDSQQLERPFTQGWLVEWIKNGWVTLEGAEPVKEQDLWEQLAEQARRHHLTFQWVKGHKGNPGNEMADYLAVTARLEAVDALK